MAYDKRFEVKDSEYSFSNGRFKIIVDNQTGVNYLYIAAGYGASITPLLDEKGNVVVTK